MSGAGRKHRAKHLTQQYLDASGWVVPKEGERLAICMEPPHSQHVRVLLLAPPNSVSTNLSTGVSAPDGNSSSETPHEAKDSEAGASVSPPSAAPLLEVEQVVHLPRKFHKVIWLSIKDVVVIVDSTVSFKPSPEQLESFLKDPRNKGWRERVVAAQHRAEDQRVALQRMPHYSLTAQTTTSVLTAPQVRSHMPTTANGLSGQEGKESEDETADVCNPNWRNIKHQQQFFYGCGDCSEEEAVQEEDT